MTSDRQLKHWLDKYNKLYYGGTLPETIIYWEPPPDAHGASCPVFEVADGKFEIKLDPVLKGIPWAWKIVLLHECAHVSLWGKHPKHQHGKVWQNEMLRLAQKGAMRNLW